MFIVLAIIAFGILIFIHELGHFLTAKAFGVKVLEFSMGMGPKLFSRQKGETLYSLRLLPIGGFCAMEGEEEESEDPRSFSAQKAWKRIIILLAGAAMNFILGFLVVLVLFAGAKGFSAPIIGGFFENCPYDGDLQVGDRIVSVEGERTYFLANFTEYATTSDGTVDIVLSRNGHRVELKDYPLVPVEYTMEDGTVVTKYGLYFVQDPATVGNVIRYSWYSCMDFVRMVRDGLVQLISGQVGIQSMSGVVGIVDTINEAGRSAPSTSEGLWNALYLIAFIAVNLAVMNVLPLPALDGGHIVTLILSALLEKILGHKPDPRLERYIHGAGLFLLMALMVFLIFNDVIRIIAR